MNEELIREAHAELLSIADVVRWGATQFEAAALFYGHGTDNAWDEAAAIVLATLSLPPDAPAEVYHCRLTGSEKKQLLQRFALRINKRLPAAYITQEAWFAGMNFYVDERVLVPRSPFAELIQQRLQPWLDDKSPPQNIADVCTGSACIACALAAYFPQAQVDALDISNDALEVAQINVENHSLDEQVQVLRSDLLSSVLEKRYDLIIANPPYVNDVAMETLPAEYQAEPRLGLAGGVDGLNLIPTLLQQAATVLNPEGLLLVEIGFNQEALQQRYPQLPLTWLEFAHGGEGVFVLSKEQLAEWC